MKVKKFPTERNQAEKSRLLKQFLIIGLSLFVICSQLSPQMGRANTEGSKSSATLTNSFFDSVALTTGDADTAKSVSIDNPLKQGDQVSLEYTWSQKDDQISDQTITVKVPANFKIEHDITEGLILPDNHKMVIGNYTVKASGGTEDANVLTVKIDGAAAKGLTGAGGRMIIPARFADEVKAGQKTKSVSFDLGNEQKQTIDVAVKEAEGQDGLPADSDTQHKELDNDHPLESGNKNDGKTNQSSEKEIDRGFSSLAVKAAAEQITENILTGAVLTDKNGHPYDENNPANTDDPANIEFTWAIPDDLGKDLPAGSIYEFDLPKIFKMHNAVNGTLDNYGTFTIDVNGHVIMKFNDQVKENSNVHGTLYVKTQFE